MPPPRIPPGTSLFSHIRPRQAHPMLFQHTRPALYLPRFTQPAPSRTFSSSPAPRNWLMPVLKGTKMRKDHKGRPRVCTGGSVRGTTVVWGEYGLRMRDHDRRVSAHQLRMGEEIIKQRLRGMKFRLFTRINAQIPVFTKGNEARMGTGKGSFDHWAARVPVSRIIFEISADCHEQIVRDALRLAGNKMPGQYEFVKKGDPPVMGITKLGNGVTPADLKRPLKKLPGEITAQRLPSAGALP